MEIPQSCTKPSICVWFCFALFDFVNFLIWSLCSAVFSFIKKKLQPFHLSSYHASPWWCISQWIAVQIQCIPWVTSDNTPSYLGLFYVLAFGCLLMNSSRKTNELKPQLSVSSDNFYHCEALAWPYSYCLAWKGWGKVLVFVSDHVWVRSVYRAQVRAWRQARWREPWGPWSPTLTSRWTSRSISTLANVCCIPRRCALTASMMANGEQLMHVRCLPHKAWIDCEIWMK